MLALPSAISERRFSLDFAFLLQLILTPLLIAISAHVRFTLPFSPVPITLQTLAIVLIGATCGPVKGSCSVMAYLIGGSLGLPFFTGPLLGPTGGYLLAFIPQTYLIGLFYQTPQRENPFLALFAVSAAMLLTLVLGSAWLALFVGAENALKMGLYPFLPGLFVKTVVGVALLSRKKCTPI